MFWNPLGAGLALVLAAGLCQAADTARPVCNERAQGQLWPEAANHDRQKLSKLARCGELLVCVRSAWHYHWEPVTVRVDQLRGGSKFRKPSSCEVVEEPSAEPSSKETAAASNATN